MLENLMKTSEFLMISLELFKKSHEKARNFDVFMRFSDDHENIKKQVIALIIYVPIECNF